MEIYRPINDDIYWKNKYFPKCIDDLEINKNIIKLITNWIKNYNQNKNTVSNKKINYNIDDIELDDNESINDTIYEKNINSISNCIYVIIL